MHGVRSHRLVYKKVVEAHSEQSLTSANLGIPLVVIQLVLTGLKNTRVVYLLDLFREEGR